MKTRREFLLSIPLFLVACNTKVEESVNPSNPPQNKTQAEIDKKLLSESNPIAMTFKYRKDGTTASANLNKNNRYGVPPEEQLCHTCQFYTAIGDDYGSCQLLPQGNVTANGWCFSWAKKGQTVDPNNPAG